MGQVLSFLFVRMINGVEQIEKIKNLIKEIENEINLKFEMKF